MGTGLVIIGLVWLIGTILKEEVFTHQVPSGTDYRQAYIDSSKLSGRELNKRLQSGYYVKKDK